jgi:hypothetical protein
MSTKYVIVLIVSVLVSGFAVGMMAQQPQPPGSLGVAPQIVESKDGHSNHGPYISPPLDLSTYVSVDPSFPLDASTMAVYQRVATTLNGSTFVPQDRLDYFSVYANSTTDLIVGWAAFVEDVEPNCNGSLVTIRTQPSISSSLIGACTILLGPNYYEQYQVGDGPVTYQGFLDPDGTSGQRFGAIGL